MKICVDPGHGGSDPGALGSRAKEKDLTLSMAKKLQKYLLARGAEVLLTRESDVYVPLSKRASLANSWGAELFVSIHVNSSTSQSAHGVETLCFSAVSEGGVYAKKVQKALLDATGWRDRGIKERRDLAVLRATDMSALLMEVGFISNPAEEETLLKECEQEKLMKKVAESLLGEIKEEQEMYRTLEEVPAWGKDTVRYLLESGALTGNGENLSLSDEMLRIFVVLDRLNVLKRK